MEKLLCINRVNLCDYTQEPSDEELAALMECVAQDVAKSNEECTRKLDTELELMIFERLNHIPSDVKP